MICTIAYEATKQEGTSQSTVDRPCLAFAKSRQDDDLQVCATESLRSDFSRRNVLADRTERSTCAGPLHSPSSGPKIADVVVPITAGHRDQKREDVPWFAA